MEWHFCDVRASYKSRCFPGQWDYGPATESFLRCACVCCLIYLQGASLWFNFSETTSLPNSIVGATWKASPVASIRGAYKNATVDSQVGNTPLRHLFIWGGGGRGVGPPPPLDPVVRFTLQPTPVIHETQTLLYCNKTPLQKNLPRILGPSSLIHYSPRQRPLPPSQAFCFLGDRFFTPSASPP